MFETVVPPRARISRYLARNWKLILGATLTVGTLFNAVHFGYFVNDRREALQEIDLFHSRVNSGLLMDVYESADPVFRQRTNQQDWQAYANNSFAKTGRFIELLRTDVHIFPEAQLRAVVSCHSRFQRVTAREAFAFLKEEDGWRLSAYAVKPDE